MVHEALLKPDLFTYTLVISAYLRLKKEKEAFTLLNELEENGISLDIRAWNSIITSCAETDCFLC